MLVRFRQYVKDAFFLENPASWNELEGFSDLGISVKNVKMSAFLKEINPETFKVSLRSTEDYDVGSVAAKFGGGGHSKAAGCEINGSYSIVLNKLLKEIKSHISRRKTDQ